MQALVRTFIANPVTCHMLLNVHDIHNKDIIYTKLMPFCLESVNEIFINFVKTKGGGRTKAKQ